MCRIFALSGGSQPVRACFWLVDAPDSMVLQSHQQPDGAGLGWFDDHGQVQVEKDDLPAWKDPDFLRLARELRATTCVAHLRFASTGATSLANTHPFVQHGRLFAHNGDLDGLPDLEREIGPQYMRLVQGETDSERMFALVTRRIDEHDGDVTAGIASAAGWIADNQPVFALNCVLADGDELWALRYPARHDLFLLEREAGGPHGTHHFEGVGSGGRMRVRSHDLRDVPSVVIASEPLDDHAGWTPLASGELVHVRADLTVERSIVLDRAPAHPLALDDLDERAARAQSPAPGGATPTP